MRLLIAFALTLIASSASRAQSTLSRSEASRLISGAARSSIRWGWDLNSCPMIPSVPTWQEIVTGPVQVTGVANGEIPIATFAVRLKPTEWIINVSKNAGEWIATAAVGRATFRKFDDGWRVEEVTAHCARTPPVALGYEAATSDRHVLNGSLCTVKAAGIIASDYAHVIPAGSARKINRFRAAVNAGSHGSLAIATIPDLRGRDIAATAHDIAARIFVVRRANESNVLVLVVPKATSSDSVGHVFIDTEFGGSRVLTDAVSGSIRDEVIPQMREGMYGPALELMALRITQRFGEAYSFALPGCLETQDR